jgi:multidrug efflux pump subunit AcrA (membrane-fusion protein)
MSTRPPTTEERPAAPPSGTPATPTTPAAGPPRSRPRRRWGHWLVAALVVVVLVGAGVRLVGGPSAGTPTPTAVPAAPKLTARGKVQPVQQARVGTLTGGVVSRLSVVAGEAVADRQEIARIRGADGATEVLTAPWAGTITSVPVNYGDTVTPGTVLATLGDLSRLQVETTDVDEFLIGKVSRGQPVRLTIDALDGRELTGVVERITLQPQPTDDGDEHYPVVIALDGATTDLRPGMTARIEFQ